MLTLIQFIALQVKFGPNIKMAGKNLLLITNLKNIYIGLILLKIKFQSYMKFSFLKS